MSTQSYRLTVIGSVLASFLVGLHLPSLHAMTEHGRPLSWSVVGIVAAIAVAVLLGLWMLLQFPAPGGRQKGSDTPDA